MFQRVNEEFNSFISAISFLTIIRLPLTAFNPAGATAYFPLAGVIIGLTLYLISFINSPITPLLLIICLAVITGALHLDGIADTSDAIFSHRSLNEKLTIMKDSHIGTMGVVALIIVILAKFISFQNINEPLYYIFIPAYSRFSMTASIYILPYIRENSPNKQFFGKKTHYMFFAGILIIVLSIIVNVNYTYLLLVWIITTYLLVIYFKKEFKGLTGDILGFICEITETVLFITTTFL
jgi:adenosylcobinamide-GDP ribazoletransferase